MNVFPRQRTSTETMVRPTHDDDATSFAGLRERGLTGVAHRWSHHLFVPDETAAGAVLAALVDLGWERGSISALPEPLTGWVVRVSRDVVITPALVDYARDSLEQVATAAGGSYAGWTASTSARDTHDHHR